MSRKVVPINHGTYNGYTNRKCRCSDCKHAASEYMRRYRKTSHGAATTKYYAVLSVKRAQLAAQWVKENMPDVWQEIARDAAKQVDKEKYIENHESESNDDAASPGDDPLAISAENRDVTDTATTSPQNTGTNQ